MNKKMKGDVAGLIAGIEHVVSKQSQQQKSIDFLHSNAFSTHGFDIPEKLSKANLKVVHLSRNLKKINQKRGFLKDQIIRL